ENLVLRHQLPRPCDRLLRVEEAAGGGKQPYNIGMRDGTPFAKAGLWERWGKKGAEPIENFTIITEPPNSLAAELHDRMPVILEPEHWDAWLTSKDTGEVQAMLQPLPAQLMHAYSVSPKVGNVKNDTPDLIEPLQRTGGPKRHLFG